MILNGYISWLTRHFKQYPIPLVVLDDSMDNIFAGYYQWSSLLDESLKWVEINDNIYDNSSGIIVITEPEDYSTLAHEYRHHIQSLLYGFWNVPNNMSPGSQKYNHYYSTCAYERDAMEVEYSLVLCDNCDLWLEAWIRRLNLQKRSRLYCTNLPLNLI